MFYSIEEIEKKSLKVYNSGDVFRDFIEEEGLFPLKIKLKKIKQSDIQNAFGRLQEEMKALKSNKFHLVYKTFQFKSIGVQTLPVEVVFETSATLLAYIDKKDAFERFTNLHELTINTYPQLKGLLLLKPFLFLDYYHVLDKLFLVCQFFIEHPKPNIYARELSISDVDTKFVEKHKKVLDLFLTVVLEESNYHRDISKLSNYGFEKKYHLKYPLPLVRFKILDSSQCINGLSDLSVTIEAFKEMRIKAKNIIIVENKITMLSFPNLEDSIVVFGLGYGVEMLKDVSWLHEKSIYYWGDIDRDGFAILSQVRGYFPHVVSIFMDRKSIEVSKDFSENNIQSYKSLAHLHKDEVDVYENFACTNRLEQERIPFYYILQSIKELTCNA